MTKAVLVVLVFLLSACTLETMQNPDDDLQRNARGHVVRATPVLEPTTGAWVNDNTWGDQFAGVMPQSEGKEVQILKNSRFYGPPKVHSVNLFRSDARLPENADVHAHITYGAGGVQNEFFCDWNQGGQFALVANTITIAARTYAPNSNANYDANTGQIFLGAMVAEGSAGVRGQTLTFTEPVTTIPGGGASQTFDVPDFAVAIRVRLFQSDDPTTPTGIDINQSVGGLLATTNDAQVCAAGRDLPLVGAVDRVAVFNTTGAPVILVVQWVLGL
jgi:hypothetical protein